jgi:hypothetical protein
MTRKKKPEYELPDEVLASTSSLARTLNHTGEKD